MRKSRFFPANMALLATLALAVGLGACGEDKKPAEAEADAAQDTSEPDGTVGSADAITGTNGADAGTQEQKKISLLIFTKTAGFRHDSIDAAKTAITKAAEQRGWVVTATEDAKTFSADGLKDIDLVAFVSTTGDVLDDTQQKAFETWIKAGGGFAGVHAAADTEHDWKFYGDLVGAYFKKHTAENTSGTALVLDRVHPSTAGLPARWQREEEWYAFKSNPRGKVHVLSIVKDGDMGHDHPHSWCHNIAGGRSFYTAGGHAKAAWSDNDFVGHVMGGFAWAGGALGGDCSATIADSWKKTPLVTGLKSPMELEVAGNGKVYFTEKAGKLKVWDPATKKVAEVASLAVDTHHEDGLLGMALSPDFASTGHVFIFHSVKTPKVNRVSRITIKDDKLVAKSSLKLFDVPVQREVCCHSGGSLAFGPDGLLYISTGDNVNPWKADGYTPVDQSADKPHYDAQGTSANSNDLRGKILRVKPTAKGYDIPKGNLFDGKNGRAEIYIMGVRNPFRIALDSKNGGLWWGETGPDAEKDSDERGPMGYDEVNFAKKAGNYGWPYCIGDNKAYQNWDFATKKSAGAFDCAKLKNTSKYNTGTKEMLPPSQPAVVWYPYSDSKDFPALTKFKGRAAFMGAVYHPTGGKLDLPPYYHGAVFWMDWMRGWIKEIRLDDKGAVMAIVDVAPKVEFLAPIDAAIGPDGALYLLEFGKGWGDNEHAKLVRLEHTGPK
ncbi:MAG: ThuA domain-containing protein [Myxococcales bacterium]|nr:ThuA domain-containing protein [Myxococcales bacterium]